MTYQANEIINPIKDGILTLLTAQQGAMGIKTLTKDMLLTQIAEDIEKLVFSFPAVIVVYYGRTAKRSGSTSMQTLTFAVVAATRSVQGPNASVTDACRLNDQVFNTLDGHNPLPALAGTFLTLEDETLQHKDLTMTIYQQLYQIELGVDRRFPATP